MPFGLGFFATVGAGASLSDYEWIETATPSGGSTTFNNIDQLTNYKHLQLRCLIRDTVAQTGNANIILRFNNDSGSNYAYHDLNGIGSTVSSNSSTTAASIQFAECLPTGNSTPSTAFGVLIIDILDFSSTSKNKTVRGLGGAYNSEADNTYTSGVWRSNNAVTSITLSPSNNYANNSRIALYGLRA